MSRATKLSQQCGEKITLLAHSFGGLLAVEIARSITDKIEALHLYGCSTFPPKCLLNLASHLAKNGYGDQYFTTSIKTAEDYLDTETFGDFIGQLVNIENFYDAYWPEFYADKKSRFYELSQQCEALHMGSFTSVMNEIISNRPVLEVSPFKGVVKLFLGESDPLIEIDEETEAWKKLFPQLEVIVCNGGHYTHLEEGFEPVFQA